MKTRRHTLLMLLRWLPIVAITACAYVPMEQSPYQSFADDFDTGKTTRGQVVEAFGPPNQAAQDYRYLLYEWEADGAFVAHPAFAVFACTSPVQSMPGMNSDALLLEFDEGGYLRRSAVVRNPQYKRSELIDRFAAHKPLEPAEEMP